MIKKNKNIYFLWAVTVLLLIAAGLILELGLRILGGYPRGLFSYLISSEDGLYAKNSQVLMNYGFKPYLVKTNSWGMRSPEMAAIKPAGQIRIMALGDSVTDGFFAENEATYPWQLGKIFQHHGRPVTVLNAAHGGGSINKELAILKKFIRLRPDLVLLTFVTNDIADLAGQSEKQLLNSRLKTPLDSAVQWFLTRTASGEFLADAFLRIRFKNYRFFKRNLTKNKSPDQRLAELGPKVQDNLAKFNQIAAKTDLLVLKEPFSERTQQLINHYLLVLGRLDQFCRENQSHLVFIYLPAYAQVYDPGVSLKIRDILKKCCENYGISFLDLTETFRKAGQKQLIFWAPFDFHPNPKGLEIIAKATAEFILKNQFFQDRRSRAPLLKNPEIKP